MSGTTGRTDWEALKERRVGEPGFHEAYEATRLAYDLGRAVRQIRVRREWSQQQLAHAAGMTQSSIARLEAGGTIPTLPVLGRVAQALGADLTVEVTERSDVA